MKIEFAENDGYLHENGIPEIFTFRVNGRMFPCPANVTIGEFWNCATRAAQAMPSVVSGAAGLETVTDEGEQQTGEVLPGSTAPALQNVIQRNDVVKYTGAPDEAGELVVGGEYLVLESKVKTVEMVDPDAAVPIRLIVAKKDLSLVKKGARITEKKQVFETVKPCDLCGEQTALQLNGEVYKGQCLKCKTHLEMPRVPKKAVVKA